MILKSGAVIDLEVGTVVRRGGVRERDHRWDGRSRQGRPWLPGLPNPQPLPLNASRLHVDAHFPRVIAPSVHNLFVVTQEAALPRIPRRR